MQFLIFIAVFFVFVPAYAQDVPVPPNKKEALGSLDERLKQYQSEEQELKKNAAKLEEELDSTQEQSIDIAKSIQDNEAALQRLEEQIALLERQQSAMYADLKEDRKAIAKLITALERIRRVPPEAMIARPDAPIDTARSAMLMRDILPALHRQSQDLKGKLEELAMLDQDLKQKREETLQRAHDLKAEQDDLEKLIDKRKALFAQTNDDLKDRQEKVATISLQAKSLSDLVKKLEDERTRNQEEMKAAAAQQPAKAVARPTPLPKHGQAQLPLQGIIRVGYHEKDSFGAPSEGITIEGRSGALIVAPMGGVIRFAGYFKNYGNMVILEHKSGYHSLIAGLEKIDTVVDQSISAGEPLGTLYKSSSGNAPTLYYELRYNGKAVNPAEKFGNLG